MRYEDGDVENILMASSRVRLEISAGEVLPSPPESEISANVQHLLREAKQTSGEVASMQWQRARVLVVATLCLADVRCLSFVAARHASVISTRSCLSMC